MKKPLPNRQLARIHILKGRAGMDDDTYRRMLVEIGGVRPPEGQPASAAQLDAYGRGKVLDHLSRLTGEDPMRPSAEEIAADPQLAKINALLLDARRPWSYLLAKSDKPESMLKRITKKDRLRFCTAKNLSDVITALVLDQQRREART